MNNRQEGCSREEFWQWGWPSQSPKGKYLTLTEQSLYKCDIVEQCLALNEWNGDQFNKKASLKLRNKMNAKKSRQRRKNQFDSLSRKIVDLQDQNLKLKSQKQCKWCRRPYNQLLIHCNKANHTQYAHKNQAQNKQIEFNRNSVLQFQKPNFRLNYKHSGKIWIAIAVLMLVIGLKIHGLEGQQHLKGLDRIIISKKQTQNWFQKFNNGDRTSINVNKPTDDDYFSMKLGFQRNNQQNQQMKKQYHSIPLKIQIEQKDIIEQDQQFKIHKEFIYSVEAQIADIGRYL